MWLLSVDGYMIGHLLAHTARPISFRFVEKAEFSEILHSVLDGKLSLGQIVILYLSCIFFVVSCSYLLMGPFLFSLLYCQQERSLKDKLFKIYQKVTNTESSAVQLCTF